MCVCMCYVSEWIECVLLPSVDSMMCDQSKIRQQLLASDALLLLFFGNHIQNRSQSLSAFITIYSGVSTAVATYCLQYWIVYSKSTFMFRYMKFIESWQWYTCLRYDDSCDFFFNLIQAYRNHFFSIKVYVNFQNDFTFSSSSFSLSTANYGFYFCF